MPAKPKRPRDPHPRRDETRQLNDLMTRMEQLDAEALQARLEFGERMKELRERAENQVSQDEIVRDLDANRELLRRIQRRYEESLKKA